VNTPEAVYQEPPAKKKKSGWLTALLVVIAVLLVFCVIPWVIIEITDSYCSFFPGIFNSIQPGTCP
jgi:flagellar basal body-associated protein FliL